MLVASTDRFFFGGGGVNILLIVLIIRAGATKEVLHCELHNWTPSFKKRRLHVELMQERGR